MKVFFITSHLEKNSGYSRYTVDLANELRKLGVAVACAVNKHVPNVEIKQDVVLGKALWYLYNPFIAWRTARKLQAIIDEFRPDVIHAVVEAYATVLPFLKKPKGTKYIVTLHGTYSYFPALARNSLRRFISTLLMKKVLLAADDIIVVSEHTRKYVLSKFPHPELIRDKMHVVPNGVQMEGASISQKSSDATKQILFVGAVKPRKGIAHTLDALIAYKKRYGQNFLFRIVGSHQGGGGYYQKLEEQVRALGLEEQVSFEGRVSEEELRRFYAAADLFIMPSIKSRDRFEGFGLVYLEANAHGVPCIGSKNSGAEEAIQNGKSGYLVDPTSPERVAERVHDVLNLGKISNDDCIQWAKEHDISRVTSRVMDVYRQ